MRRKGLKFVLIGLSIITFYWFVYNGYSDIIISGNKLMIYLILIIGMIVTMVGGALIAIGLRIIIRPEFYERLRIFIFSDEKHNL